MYFFENMGFLLNRLMDVIYEREMQMNRKSIYLHQT
jgi:hypothetical protein